MKIKLVCTLSLILLATASDAQAPPDTLPDAQLAPMVVTAQFGPTDVRQTVNSVRVISRENIERRAANNLEELLQTQPNMRTTQDAILGSALTINGLQGENVKILIDGVPVIGRSNGSIDAGQLPLEAVQQVEIIEGAQSLLYGSEASAGVVNLVTRKSQAHRVEAGANYQWESNGFQNLQARTGLRLGKFLLQLSGNQLDFMPSPDTAGLRDQLWNPKKQTSGRAMLRFSPSQKFDVRLTGNLFSENVDNLGEMRRPNYKPYAFDDYYQTKRSDIALHTDARLQGQWLWQSTVGWNKFDRVKNSYRFDFEDEKKTLLEGEQDTSAATGLLIRTTLARDRYDKRWNFLLGMENYSETVTGARIDDPATTAPNQATGNDFAVFASAKARFFQRKLTLQSGVRWTENKLYGTSLNPSFWLLWQPDSKWQIRFSYANGFRSPGLKELYFNFIDINHYIVGNTDLKPERSHNLRGELRRQLLGGKNETSNPVLAFSLAGFYNKVNDRIVLSEFAPVQYRYANLNEWETTGAGASADFWLGDWLKFRTELVATGYFNVYAEENDSLRRLNWSPDWVNDLSVSFWKQRASFSVWHKMTGITPYFFEGDKGSIEQGESEGWHLVNASLGASFFKRKLRLNTGVKNILGIRQIRSDSSSEIGHSGGDSRPVHWGRTFFVSAAFTLHSKS